MMNDKEAKWEVVDTESNDNAKAGDEKSTIEATQESTQNKSVNETIDELVKNTPQLTDLSQRILQNGISSYPPLYTPIQPEVPEFDSYAPELIEQYQNDQQQTREFQERCLIILQSIADNTANLNTIVELIHQSNENQEELIEIAREILSISAATDRADADNRLKKIIGKINDVVTNGEKVIKLIGFATTIYNLVVGLLK